MFFVQAFADVRNGVHAFPLGGSNRLVKAMRFAEHAEERNFTFMHPDARVEILELADGRAYSRGEYGDVDRPPPQNSPVICTLKKVDGTWEAKWHNEAHQVDYDYQLARERSTLVA